MGLRDRSLYLVLLARRAARFDVCAGALLAGSIGYGAQGCTALVDTSTTACTTHAQCQRRFDENVFCRHDGVCAPLFSEECTELHWFGEDAPVRADGGDLPDTNTVILGFMGPGNKQKPGIDEAYAEPLRSAAREAVKSIQRVYPGGTPLTLALLDCNDSAEPAAVFRHLAENVRAPAVIGPVFSSTTLKVLDSLDRVGDTMLLSPSATAINFSNEVSPRLWRTVPPDTYQVEALLALYQKLRDDEPGRSGKLSVVACQQEGWCNSFRGTLVGQLARADIDYTLDSYDRSKLEGGVLGELATKLKRDKPDVIIGVGIGELGEQLLPELESGADAIAPIYLFPEAERGTGLEQAVREHPAIAGRVLGAAPGARIPQAGSCGTDLGNFLGQVTDGNLGEFAYDAAFLLAYALSSLPDRHPGGLTLTSAMQRLSCKEDDARELRANTELYTGSAKQLGQTPDSCVDYCGVSGPLDFPAGPLSDGDKREAASDIGFWCPSLSAGGTFSYKVPPGDFAAPGASDKPYYAVTGDSPGIRGEAQLRLCRASSASDAGVDAGMPPEAGVGAGMDAGAPKDAGVDAAMDASPPADARGEDPKDAAPPRG